MHSLLCPVLQLGNQQLRQLPGANNMQVQTLITPGEPAKPLCQRLLHGRHRS
jgi:hypothetical protein